MSIEPLSNVMTTQVVSTPKTQPVVEKQEVKAPENTNSAATSFIDESTQIVKNVQDKGKERNAEQQEKQQEKQQPTPEQLKKAVEQINKKMQNSEALFGIHDKTNRITIKIVDRETKEVIKELPPEKTLDMIAKAWELAGLLVDERR